MPARVFTRLRLAFVALTCCSLYPRRSQAQVSVQIATPTTQRAEIVVGSSGRIPQERPPRPLTRLVVDFTVRMGMFSASPYSSAASLWGYQAGGYLASEVVLEGGYHVHEHVLLGVRLGRMGAFLGRATFDGAALEAVMYDVSAIGRFVRRYGTDTLYVTIGGQIDVGVGAASLYLRDQTQSATLFRGGLGCVIAVGHRNVLVPIYLGGMISQWPDAGGPRTDLTFGGLTAGGGLEVRL